MKQTDERYTPSYIIERVIKVLGKIELDPTSNSLKSIPADRHLTITENCLTTDWKNPKTVFMNPPYSNSHLFLNRLFDQYNKYKFNAISLTLPGILHNKKTSEILKEFTASNDLLICTYTGRIQFNNSGTSNNRNSLFTCIGDENCLNTFYNVFKDIGLMFKP